MMVTSQPSTSMSAGLAQKRVAATQDSGGPHAVIQVSRASAEHPTKEEDRHEHAVCLTGAQ